MDCCTHPLIRIAVLCITSFDTPILVINARTKHTHIETAWHMTDEHECLRVDAPLNKAFVPNHCLDRVRLLDIPNISQQSTIATTMHAQIHCNGRNIATANPTMRPTSHIELHTMVHYCGVGAPSCISWVKLALNSARSACSLLLATRYSCSSCFNFACSVLFLSIIFFNLFCSRVYSLKACTRAAWQRATRVKYQCCRYHSVVVQWPTLWGLRFGFWSTEIRTLTTQNEIKISDQKTARLGISVTHTEQSQIVGGIWRSSDEQWQFGTYFSWTMAIWNPFPGRMVI